MTFHVDDFNAEAMLFEPLDLDRHSTKVFDNKAREDR